MIENSVFCMVIYGVKKGMAPGLLWTDDATIHWSLWQ